MELITCEMEYDKEEDKWDFAIRVRSESFIKTIETVKRVLDVVM